MIIGLGDYFFNFFSEFLFRSLVSDPCFDFQKICWLYITSFTALLCWCVHGENFLIMKAEEGEIPGRNSVVALWLILRTGSVITQYI